MRHALGPAMAMLAACNGGGATLDASNQPGDGGPVTLTCWEVASALRTKTMTVSRACTTSADCTIVGYAERSDGLPTCDCAPAYASPCSGVGANAMAWNSDAEVQALLAEWDNRCRPMGCAAGICGCDCGLGQLSCSTNGVCGVSIPSCFP